MIREFKLSIIISALLLAGTLWGCGDDGAGVDAGDPPKLPDITAAQPDFSYFEQTAQKIPAEIQFGDAYGSARGTVTNVSFLFASFSQLGVTYYQLAESEEAVYEDGQWVWSYSYSAQGQSFEFELTSEVNEDANEARWALYMSSSGGEVTYDHFKFIEGTASLDGKNGDWTFYTLTEAGASEPLMSYEWAIDADENLTATFSFPGDDSFASMQYVENGSIHTLTLTGEEGNTIVYWDTAQDHGYWSAYGDQLCWTSDKSDIACSDIGL